MTGTLRDTVFGRLRRGGYAVIATDDPDRFVVDEQAVLVLPEALLDEHLAAMRDDVTYPAADREAEAVSLFGIHLYETVDADDGGGRNATREFGLRRNADGRVEFYVEREPWRPDPPSGGMLGWTAERPE